jgi:hypothetical protein
MFGVAMIRLLIVLIAANLIFSTFSFAASSENADLEKQLQQKQDQIDRLEQEVEYLRNQLMDMQNNAQESTGNSGPMGGNLSDPLIGTWECTNKVYNYDISFFEDGRFVQEEPFVSKARSGSWTRLVENRIFFEQGGQTFITAFPSHDELIVTNSGTKAVWECYRK